MEKLPKLRDLIGILKDKASQSKVTFFLRRRAAVSFHLAVLRATTHSPDIPPPDDRISTLVSLGDTSLAAASAVLQSLVDRLHRTRDPSVALKCLLAIHHIVRRGPFVLLGLIPVVPFTGGHNFLKLSSFSNRSTTTALALSAWVRWYARYLESLLSNLGLLGLFPSTSSSYRSEAALSKAELIGELNSLVGVMEEICKLPDSILFEGNKLLYEVKMLVGSDHLSVVNGILRRIGEFEERLSSASFVDSMEFMCVLKRIEECKERVSEMFIVKRPSVRKLWALTEKLKSEASSSNACRGKLPALPGPEGAGGGEMVGESARFRDRVSMTGEPARSFGLTR